MHSHPIFVSTGECIDAKVCTESRGSCRLIAMPAIAGPGKYNKAVSVGDKAPDFAGLPAVENGDDTSLTLATSRKTSSFWSSWAITARSFSGTKTA